MTIASVTEMIITVQFAEPLRPLNAIEIAQLYGQFAAQYPIYEQVQPAGPMAYKLTHLDGSEPLPFAGTPFPRLRFATLEGGRSIMFQADRLSYGWQRNVPLTAQDDYPGFDVLLDEFREVWSRFHEFMERFFNFIMVAHVGEIAYVNGFLMSQEDGTPVRLSSIYSFLNTANTIRMNSFNYSWNKQTDVADGIVSVVVNGPAMADPGPASLLTLAGTFLISDTTNMDDAFLLIRKQVGETFRSIVSDERRAI